MVSRLVEQQQVWARQQYLCQFYTHTPSARKLRRWSIKVCTQKSQTYQRALYFRHHIVCPHQCQSLVFHRQMLDQFGIFCALIVGPFCQLLCQSLHSFLRIYHVAKGCFCLIHHGFIVVHQQMLWQIPYLKIFWHRHSSTRRLLQSGKHLQHCRLTRTVLTHKSYLLLWIHQKRHLFK